MKKWIQNYWKYLTGIIGFLILIYYLGVLFFATHYLPRTMAGNVGISELTPQQAQTKIQNNLNGTTLQLSENNKNLGSVAIEELDLQLSSQGFLIDLLDKQNEYTWPIKLFFPEADYDLSSIYSFDQKALDKMISLLGIVNDQREPTYDAKLIQEENGGVKVQEAVYGNRVTSTSLSAALAKSLAEGQTSLDISKAYVQPKLTSESKAIKEKEKKYQQLKEVKITHQFDGNEVIVPQDIVGQWVEIDSQGEIVINQEKIREYLFSVNEKYSARFKPRLFHSTYQGEIEIQPGTFGWYIDADQESEILKEIVMKGEDTTREPIIVGVGYGQDPSLAIGNSYVEVDLTNQMMFVYQDGNVVIQTPIVSGMIGSETVPGAYQVWSMEQDTNLKGYNPHTKKDYVQPVKYWIAFDNNAQGIHDATWQSNFGGQVYQQSGSLGCINTPLDIMTQVYEVVDYGWPVIVF